VAAPAKTIWTYGETKDEMRGTVRKYATTESLNTVDFAFPYAGEQRGTIMVTSDSSVLFYIHRGQIVCSGLDEFGTCLVLVKFDDGKADYVTAAKSGDASTAISFDAGFLKQLERHKKLAIQVDVYREGVPIFSFDVGGLHDPRRMTTAQSSTTVPSTR
jgi:hypothetical protein